MYHTFQATSANGDGQEAEAGMKTGKTQASRRISTSNACVECRRRKIRCDGAQPCGQCQWYQHPELCAYSKPAQRVVPSRKLVERLQSQVDQCHSIVSRLFPGQELETLLTLPREELVNLALTMPAPTTSPSNNGSDGLGSVARENGTMKSEGAESLDALEQAPEQDPEIDEARRHRDKVQSISDDVNGLSLSVDRQSSYVGVSSITAALKVIFKTAPISRPFIAHSYNETALPSRANSPPPQMRDPDPFYLPPADIGHKLIDSYFKHVHCMMPMIDEDQFWHTYLYGERKDSPWMSLLNIVMALGSMSMSTCDNEDHIVYFKRSRKHLDLETFGSGNLLVLQALGLMSGYYLHWLNRPNEANSLMGATMRMATALGLHREYGPIAATAAPMATIQSHAEVPAEIRRRTWWSLFCLDTWANLTTGRPALGRMGPGITVQSPKIPQQMNNAQYLASLRLLPIIHNIEFCKIATKVQDAFAVRPLLKFEELFTLDAELVKWHDELPPLLRDLVERPPQRQRAASNPKALTPSSLRKNPFDFSQPPERDHTTCPEVLYTPRAVMHWRYQNLRMLMHRPFLLAAALRKSPYASMSPEEKVAVGRCRILAGQTISDIVETCQEELIAGWNAVWLMYQAVMVPLVSLFSQLSQSASHGVVENSPGKSPDGIKGSDDDIAKWQHQVETAILFFDKMRRFSVAAKKSKDVVERLYEASKQVSAYTAEHQHQLQQFPGDHHPHTDNPEHHHPSFGPEHPNPNQPHRIDPVSFDLGPLPPVGMTSFHPHDLAQQQNGGGGSMFGWGLSPNGDAAMNVFWDDMMWETLPEVPEQQPGWIPGFDQFDFGLAGAGGPPPPQTQPPQGQGSRDGSGAGGIEGAGGINGEGWEEWMGGENAGQGQQR